MFIARLVGFLLKICDQPFLPEYLLNRKLFIKIIIWVLEALVAPSFDSRPLLGQDLVLGGF